MANIVSSALYITGCIEGVVDNFGAGGIINFKIIFGNNFLNQLIFLQAIWLEMTVPGFLTAAGGASCTAPFLTCSILACA